MRILGARIFLSLLAGKLEPLDKDRLRKIGTAVIHIKLNE